MKSALVSKTYKIIILLVKTGLYMENYCLFSM
jgi:hypothetical protein